jgi:hypothetical protein
MMAAVGAGGEYLPGGQDGKTSRWSVEKRYEIVKATLSQKS